ncbi:hypothetical protein BKA81DRAFT_410468 [Phyllosticta paracitricarpa]
MSHTKNIARRASEKVKRMFLAYRCAGRDMDESIPAEPVSHPSTRGERAPKSAHRPRTSMGWRISLGRFFRARGQYDSDEGEAQIAPKLNRLERETVPPRSSVYERYRPDPALSTIFELHEPLSRLSSLTLDMPYTEEYSDYDLVRTTSPPPPAFIAVDEKIESDRWRNPWLYGPIVFAVDWPFDGEAPVLSGS